MLCPYTILMNKQELFKQADYTFQRGNRELAKKYLTDFLAQYPNEESAWMLMARIVEDPERKIECYERAIKINPNNSEAKIGLARIKLPAKTLPKRNLLSENPRQISSPFKNILRGVSIFAVLAILLGTTAYVMVGNNPESAVAKLLILPTPTSYAQVPITGDIASQTRAEMSANYPQYAPLVDALIGFAVDNAESGLEGAPERPGAKIQPSDSAGAEAKASLEEALPQPGSLSSARLTETQITSWLAMEMKNNPDLPLSEVQVYLRNDKIQIWGMVMGSTNSTSALIVGNLGIDSYKNPKIEVESIQIGTQTIPDALVSQMETWINQILVEEINKQAPGLEIMNISTNNGLITVSGMR
jgi:tetratricopeptide (TPR) repeat protein